MLGQVYSGSVSVISYLMVEGHGTLPVHAAQGVVLFASMKKNLIFSTVCFGLDRDKLWI